MGLLSAALPSSRSAVSCSTRGGPLQVEVAHLSASTYSCLVISMLFPSSIWVMHADQNTCQPEVITASAPRRWTVDDASIFSVADGKKLAQTPYKPPTFYERLRAEKQQRAALETPLVRGMRLLPEFTPGRAMLWGTILAVWGTAAVFASTARSLDIKTVSSAVSRG